jgi:hypothetical protein
LDDGWAGGFGFVDTLFAVAGVCGSGIYYLGCAVLFGNLMVHGVYRFLERLVE